MFLFWMCFRAVSFMLLFLVSVLCLFLFLFSVCCFGCLYDVSVSVMHSVYAHCASNYVSVSDVLMFLFMHTVRWAA